MESKEDLLYMLAHDIRGPLSTIRVLVDLLESRLKHKTSLDPQDLMKTVQKINRCLIKGNRMLEYALSISQASSNLLKLDKKEFDFAEVVSACVEDAKLDADHVGSTLKVDLVAVRGMWDELRINEVVSNLLSNAIKYGSGKEIEVILEKTVNSVILEIKDHGVGVPEAQIGRIFEKGVRANNEAHGNGLGLWIVKKLVELHGGSVKVESVEGAGSTFIVELPLNSP